MFLFMYNPNIHKRKSIRLRDYDYSSAGIYFITICTEGRQLILGKVINDKMILSDFGKIVYREWEKLPKNYNHIELNGFIIMPNHIHGIIKIKNVGASLVGAQNANEYKTKNGITQINNNKELQIQILKGQPQGIAPTKKMIGHIIGMYKSITTNKYISGVKLNKYPSFKKRIWQRNYYEHIIRNESSLSKIKNYIINNPREWKNDKFYI